jgi:hypothetical protein
MIRRRKMKPILFSTNMVRAILDDKTQTRRPIKYTFLPGYNPEWTGYKPIFEYGEFFLAGSNGEPATKPIIPQYQVGEILYVRETWLKYKEKYYYKADDKHKDLDALLGGKSFFKWHPSIHMPKEAARIFLRVTDVQVERVQEITEEDARAEGMSLVSLDDRTIVTRASYREAFRWAWDSIYAAKGYGWDVNSWVFVYEFERCDKEGE